MAPKGLFNIRPAKELVGDRFAFVVAGPYGTGKSTLLGSMAKEHKTLLLATLSREVESWLYKEYNVDTIPLWEEGFYSLSDDGTLPPGFRITKFHEFLQVTEALRDDDVYDAVILDNGTELAELAWHQAMAVHGVIAPAYMQDKKSRFQPYETMGTNLDQAIKNLVTLVDSSRTKRPKFIGISWHVQPPRDDQTETVGEGANSVRVQKQSADHKAEGVEYEGKVLPMIRGAFRRKLGSQVSTFVFADIIYEVKTQGARSVRVPRYVLQVQPDEERHAKIPGPMAASKYIANDFGSLYDLVQKNKVAEVAAPDVDVSEKPGVSRLRRS